MAVSTISKVGKSQKKSSKKSSKSNQKISIARHGFGIDMGKAEFHAVYRVLSKEGKTIVRAYKKFANTAAGIQGYYKWAEKQLKGSNLPCSYLMEATGVYYEELAYFLHSKNCCVKVVLPNQSKAYAKSLNQKTKTDKVDAKTLSLMVLERISLRDWKPISSEMRHLKKVTRLRTRLVAEKTRAQNQLQAEKASFESDELVMETLKASIAEKKELISKLEKSLQKTVKEKDSSLHEKIEKICELKGLGFITVLTVVVETNGFKLFENVKQLVSFAGYDVTHHQSGDKVGKTQISKKGNRYIRRALYMPSLSVVKWNPDSPFANLHQRVFEKTNIKNKGYVAVQRKMLIIIYTLFKNDQAYDADLHKMACSGTTEK